MKDFPAEIKSTFTGLSVDGNALIQWWDDTLGIVKMDRIIIDNISHDDCVNNQEVVEAEIKKHLNDGGFGCKELLAAIVHIHAVYSDGAKVYLDNCILNNTDKQIEDKYIEQLELYYN